MKYILVPGYGKNHGILESDLTAIVCSTCKQIKIDASTFISDIEWLLDEGVIKRHYEPPRLYRRVIYLSQAAMPDRIKLS